MVRLRKQRTALFLYAVLLVLPTLVLGGIQWRQMQDEYESEVQSLPTEADDAALRLSAEMHERLDRLLTREAARPFHQYGARYCPDDTCKDGVFMVDSPLVREPRPQGVLGWFVFDVQDMPLPQISLFLGDLQPEESLQLKSELEHATEDLAQRTVGENPLRRAARLGEIREVRVPLGLVAAHRMQEIDPQCLRQNEAILAGYDVELIISPFHLQFYTVNGEPRLVATRRILMDEQPALSTLDACMRKFGGGFGLVQGFWLDPHWLFDELPQGLSKTVLGRSQRFVAPGSAPCCDGQVEYHAEVRPVSVLGFETYDDKDRDFGVMRIAVDTQTSTQRFREREMRFFGLAAMLLAALGTGMWMLLRSVRHDLDQAARTENFVAAVTHELRTPLSSIKLHAEMLLDGWAKDEAKQREYYRRIGRETERLSAMVERVLEKSRLSAGRTTLAPGDLNRAIRALEPQLARARDDERQDLAFDLADELPEVLMAPEAIVSIVTNLVENARKYAPVDPEKPDAEPIRVVTHKDGNLVLLEVQDRGPGIPAAERGRIFEAFYRVGNEKTRTARGTGLGLHLVALHAEALGGSVAVVERPGGGSIFRVTLRPAPHV